MAITTYIFPDWNGGYAYKKWDVFYSNGYSMYFYATRDDTSAYPLARYVYNPTSVTRSNNVARVTFTQTGTDYFTQGSVVTVSGCSPSPQGSACDYTGLVLAGGPGYIDFLSPGLDTTSPSNITQGGVVGPIHPSWTTGFYWIPSYSTDITNNQAVIESQLGEGYSQRQNPFINANSLGWNLVFDERTEKETTALLNYVQNQGGVTPFNMPFPVGTLVNRGDLKYVAGGARTQINSYGLQSVSFPVKQVFDIS